MSSAGTMYSMGSLRSRRVVNWFWNHFKKLPVNSGKSWLCSHVWSTGGCSGKWAEPLEFGGMWLSSGSLDLTHLGHICWTCRYPASPPYTAQPVPEGGKEANKEHILQSKRWTQRKHGALHGPRSPLYIGTPGETTLLQAQVSLGTIRTRLEGTPRQSAHPLP